MILQLTGLALLFALALALVSSAALPPWFIWVEIELLLFWMAPRFSWAYPSLIFVLALALVLVLGLVFFSLLSRFAPPPDLEYFLKLARNFEHQAAVEFLVLVLDFIQYMT